MQRMGKTFRHSVLGNDHPELTVQRHARDNHLRRPHGLQPARPCTKACKRLGQTVVTFSQQTGRLCEVGRNNIGGKRQSAHPLTQFLRVCIVDHAVIAHHRINDDAGSPTSDGINKVLHDPQLLNTSQKSCEDSIKALTQRCPVFQVIRQMRCHVQKAVALITVGLTAQHSRGHRTALHPHYRQHRNGRHKRAVTQTRQIFHTYNTLHERSPRLLKSFYPYIILTFTLSLVK